MRLPRGWPATLLLVLYAADAAARGAKGEGLFWPLVVGLVVALGLGIKLYAWWRNRRRQRHDRAHPLPQPDVSRLGARQRPRGPSQP